MKLRDLLVVFDGSARDTAVLARSVALARRNDAHLTGLCPLEPLFPADRDLALYGHSRRRGMIFGGVTRDLLDHMTLPVLMSH